MLNSILNKCLVKGHKEGGSVKVGDAKLVEIFAKVLMAIVATIALIEAVHQRWVYGESIIRNEAFQTALLFAILYAVIDKKQSS